MLFAESPSGRYAGVRMHHRFAGHVTLGDDALRTITPTATRLPTRQLLPTQLEPLPPAPYAPTRTSSLITSSDGTYQEQRTTVAVPNAYLPVAPPDRPVAIPTVQSSPTPVANVYPDPIISRVSTKPAAAAPPAATYPQPSPAPVPTTQPPVTISPGPPTAVAPYVPPDGSGFTPPPTSALIPEVAKTSGNVKWAVIGGLGVLGILGLVLILK